MNTYNFIKNRFYNLCILLITHHLRRAKITPLPQWKSPHSTLHIHRVKPQKIDILKNLEFYTGFCTVQNCTVLYSTVQYSTVQYCTVLYSTVQYCTVLYSTVRYCTVLYSAVQYCTVLYSTVLYSTVQYCTVLYSTLQYCTVLYKQLYCIRYSNWKN